MNGRTTVTMAAGSVRRRIPLAALAAAAVLAAFGFGALGCVQKGPGTAKTSEELLTQLKDDRTKIDQASDTMMKRIEMFNASRQPGERTLKFSEIFTQDLSPEQQDVLNTLVAEEKDFSYKALLQKIIADRDTIRGLQENVMRLEQSLSDKFVVVKRGDRQQDLAMTYLTEEAHLDAAKAKSLLSQIDMSDELLAGNKVWFFYDPKNDLFRTYVTQGEAGQTPLAVRRARQRQLIQERDTAQAEVATLEVNKAELEANKAVLEANKAELEANKAELEANKAQLESDIAFRENSLFYHAASKRALKDQGVLTSVLTRVRDVKGISYDEALDLRQGTTITLTPSNYGLTEIRDVRLIPAIYQEGRDFTIQTAEDHSSAQVVILDPDLFRGKEVLLAVGG